MFYRSVGKEFKIRNESERNTRCMSMGLLCKNCGVALKKVKASNCPVCGAKIIDDSDDLSFIDPSEAQSIEPMVPRGMLRDSQPITDNGKMAGSGKRSLASVSARLVLDKGEKRGELSITTTGVQFTCMAMNLHLLYQDLFAVGFTGKHCLTIGMRDGRDYDFIVEKPQLICDSIEEQKQLLKID
jgi:hypothetical protein